MFTLRCTLLTLALAAGCGNPAPDRAASGQASSAKAPAEAEPVTPPFSVTGDLEGLLLVWYDEQGAPHSAARRSEVPEQSREAVRIDALDLPPEQRLDADQVYVADLRSPAADGAYRVHRWPREAFEARVVPRADKAEEEAVAAGEPQVIIYGASWCGACKQAAKFLTSRGVPFIEKDIEKEPGAREEMQAKARAQGVSTRGIPVIDVRGKLLPGFDPNQVLSALGRGT